ncbi:MAG: hypothetical protein NT154_15140, partial [Verrucomicrobia bacterium]|nr:hypothetical protein [Verrucomicrobiota bacterium]
QKPPPSSATLSPQSTAPFIPRPNPIICPVAPHFIPKLPPRNNPLLYTSKNRDVAFAALATAMATANSTVPDAIENPGEDIDRADTAIPTPYSEECPISSPPLNKAPIHADATSSVKVQTADRVFTAEPARVIINQSIATPDELDFSNYLRGPEFVVRQTLLVSRFPLEAIAQVALTAQVPLAVIGLNSSKSKSNYRVNLLTEALKEALGFDPRALAPNDKRKGVEFILYGEEVAERLDAAIERHGLLDRIEVLYPIEPIILNARLATSESADHRGV